MAIREVKTEKITICGQDYRAKITFDSEREVFLIQHPRYMVDVIGTKESYGKDLAGARKDLEKNIEKYGERIKTRRKVIVFKVAAEVRRQDPFEGEERFGSGSGRWGQKEFDYKGSMSVHFFIGYETTVGKDKEYKDELGSRPDHELVSFHSYGGRGGDHHVIEWSQEREDFFRSMIDSIEKAKARLDSIFGETDIRSVPHDERAKTPDILARIDSIHSGPLLGFSGPKSEEAK